MGIVQSNLVLYLEAALANGGVGPGLNSPLTTTFKDLSGSNKNGMLNGFAGTTSSGYAGTGTLVDPYRVAHDGSNDYISVGVLPITNALTVELWASFPTLPLASPYAFPRYVWGTSDYFSLYGDKSGALLKVKCPSSSDDVRASCAQSYIGGSGPHHIVYTHGGGSLSLVIDGVSVSSATCANATLTCGSLPWSTSDSSLQYPSDIQVVALRIYNRVLSPSEIAQNRATGYVLAPRSGGRFPLLSRGMRT